MLRLGVIGYGYWGPNLVRNFMDVEGACVTSVCDLKSERLERVCSRFPSIVTTRNPDELIGSPSVDAVAIATPVSSHFDLALRALQAGKHVLVEKPLAETSEKSARLIEVSEDRGLVLMVDHTFPYTGAVRKIKDLADQGRLGDIYYYDSTRVNLGLFQHDVSVIWDLAVHDLSIIDYLLPEKPTAVSATGMSHFSSQPENIAYLTLLFPGNTIAHIHVNWLAPIKLRQTLIGGSKTMVLYDDLEPTEKIKVYDKGVNLVTDRDNIHEMRVGYRTGDMWAPNLERVEALRVLAEHFIRCCVDGEEPITGAASGLRVVRTMEAATRSMARNGHLTRIDDRK